MSGYTTLGSGRTAKILCTDVFDKVEVVTTCPADAAREVASWLNRTRTELLSALHPVAVAANGTPVQARRALLDRFDAAVGGTAPVTADTDVWVHAHTLVDRLAATLGGCPAPVVRAVRTELGKHLAGCDGVLVAGTFTATAYRPSCLRIVITPVLDPQLDMFSLNGTLFSPGEDNGIYPVGGPTADVGESAFELMDACFGQTPVMGAPYEEAPMVALQQESGVDDPPTLEVPYAHLRAWAAHHAPELLDRFTD